LNAQTRDQVNVETLKRVMRAALQLGDVPNAMARLRTSRSMTIGMIIADLLNRIFAPIIRGIEHALQPRGYTVLVANTDSHDDVEVSAFESLPQRRSTASSSPRVAPVSSRSSRRHRPGMFPSCWSTVTQASEGIRSCRGATRAEAVLSSSIWLSWATATSCTSRASQLLHCTVAIGNVQSGGAQREHHQR
jgi:hypothetical protein